MLRLITVFSVLALTAPTRHVVVVNGDVQSVVIPIDVAANTTICAEYRQRMAKPNRSCWDAERVRAVILANGMATEQCH